jgi:hypothetical protein
LTKELAEETVVYDSKRNEAHCLNRTAALIWRHCDGRTSVAELVTLLRKRDLPADEAVVWLALDRLAKAHLLQERLPPAPRAVSRRQVMRKIGMAGGLSVLLPTITSIIAPTPATAASAITGGFQNCGTANDAGDCVVTTACPAKMSCTGITTGRTCYCLPD